MLILILALFLVVQLLWTWRTEGFKSALVLFLNEHAHLRTHPSRLFSHSLCVCVCVCVPHTLCFCVPTYRYCRGFLVSHGLAIFPIFPSLCFLLGFFHSNLGSVCVCVCTQSRRTLKHSLTALTPLLPAPVTISPSLQNQNTSLCSNERIMFSTKIYQEAFRII